MEYCLSYEKSTAFLSFVLVTKSILWLTDLTISSAFGKPSLTSSRRIPPRPFCSWWSSNFNSDFLSRNGYFGLNAYLSFSKESFSLFFRASSASQCLSVWLMSVFFVWSKISSRVNGSKLCSWYLKERITFLTMEQQKTSECYRESFKHWYFLLFMYQGLT